MDKEEILIRLDDVLFTISKINESLPERWVLRSFAKIGKQKRLRNEALKLLERL
jgi:hypothetical protein